jgi:predicted nicotinamide N-methyase
MHLVSRIAHLDCELATLQVGGRTLSLWRPVHPEAYILGTAEEAFGEDERLPYWALLWPASIALASRLVAGDGWTGLSVLELGAGLGLPSLAAASAGADVTATDWYLDALEFIQASARENGLALATKFLDWRHPPDGAGFDCIIGADLLYERRHFEPILETVERLLAPAGKVILSDPDRHRTPDFFRLAAERGWESSASPHPVEWEGGRFAVQCWEMRRGYPPLEHGVAVLASPG